MTLSAKSPYDREGHRKYLTRAEGKRFLDCVVNLPKSKALFCLTLYYTGCRISEALSLGSGHLDCEVNLVRIATLKKRGRREIRRIPIPEFLSEELQKISGTRTDEVFWTISRTTAWRTIKRVMSEAGISGIHATTKGLRHGFGVRSALEQIPVSLIQNWMGHADSTTTAIYLAVQDDEERSLIEKTW